MEIVIDKTAITDEELLASVKALLDYGENDYDDEKLKLGIRAAKTFMLAGGIPSDIVNSVSVVDVIAYYVDDYNRRNGISDFVILKVAQLRAMKYE